MKGNETPITIAQQHGFDDLVQMMTSGAGNTSGSSNQPCQQDASGMDSVEFDDEVDYSQASTSSHDQLINMNRNNFAAFTPQMPKLIRCSRMNSVPYSVNSTLIYAHVFYYYCSTAPTLQRVHQQTLNTARTTMIDGDRYGKNTIENTNQ